MKKGTLLGLTKSKQKKQPFDMLADGTRALTIKYSSFFSWIKDN